MSQADLKGRVEAAAAAALARQKFVTPIDVCVGIGWLHTSNVEDWRRGRVDDLECFLPVHDDRLIDLILYVNQWAQEHGLTRTDSDYVSATRDRRPLRFFTNGDPLEEAAWRSQWISADVPAAQRERIVKRQAAPPDLVVVQPVKDWTCAECGGTDGLLIMDEKGPLCLTCADMDHLVFLPSGDAALTRRAKKASTLSAVVVRWNRSRKRYERQGLLVEEPALEQAEQQCLADSGARMRRRERDAERRASEDLELQARVIIEIARLFPGCPVGRAEAIARHTSLRGSGRVGRSAAGRSLDDKAITLAVVASVRHEDTEYDSLLMSGVPREAARDQIRPDIDRVLNGWALPWLHGAAPRSPTGGLVLTRQMAGYTRQAGLGPWTQLGDEVQRLQVLTEMESIAGSSRSQPCASKSACASITRASTGSALRRWASAWLSALGAAGSVPAVIDSSKHPRQGTSMASSCKNRIGARSMDRRRQRALAASRFRGRCRRGSP